MLLIISGQDIWLEGTVTGTGTGTDTGLRQVKFTNISSQRVNMGWYTLTIPKK